MGLSNDLSGEAGSFSCCRPNPHGRFQSEVWGFISPCWSPGLQGPLPTILLVHLCANVGPRGPTHRSARPTVRHSESGPLSLSVRECGSTGFTSARTACAIRPTLRQSQSRHGHASPLHPGARLLPSYQSGRMFIFHPLGVGPPSPFNSLSALVVRGGAVCPPMPPSWFSSFISVCLFFQTNASLEFVSNIIT